MARLTARGWVLGVGRIIEMHVLVRGGRIDAGGKRINYTMISKISKAPSEHKVYNHFHKFILRQADSCSTTQGIIIAQT
ncbi:AAA family ATPase [Fusarium oxysporum f. sp. albedinis]|nr:AAA family ATPase [Fusarium oxysporum f. sp. albedinis]